jgi:hypothetical protein
MFTVWTTARGAACGASKKKSDTPESEEEEECTGEAMATVKRKSGSRRIGSNR